MGCLVPRPLSVCRLGQSVSDHVVRSPWLRHRNELVVRAWEKAVQVAIEWVRLSFRLETYQVGMLGSIKRPLAGTDEQRRFWIISTCGLHSLCRYFRVSNQSRYQIPRSVVLLTSKAVGSLFLSRTPYLEEERAV